MEGIQHDPKTGNVAYNVNVIGRHDRRTVIEMCTKYYQKSPEAKGMQENLKAHKSALHSHNGMSKKRDMRLIGTIPIFIWLLAIRLTGDAQFWRQDNCRSQRLFFDLYPSFRTKKGGKGNRVALSERSRQ